MSKKISSAEHQLLRAQRSYRGEAERDAKDAGLTAAHVLEAPAQVDPDHEVLVRSVAPAALIILEKDAPPRIELLLATRGEFAALREFLFGEAEPAHIWGAYLDTVVHDESRELAPDTRRKDEHAARLRQAEKSSGLRVSDGISR